MSEEIKKEIERIEQEHINFCGYKASDCGACEERINELKKKLNKSSYNSGSMNQENTNTDERGYC